MSVMIRFALITDLLAAAEIPINFPDTTVVTFEHGPILMALLHYKYLTAQQGCHEIKGTSSKHTYMCRIFKMIQKQHRAT